jgi:hypothetical protein
VSLNSPVTNKTIVENGNRVERYRKSFQVRIEEIDKELQKTQRFQDLATQIKIKVKLNTPENSDPSFLTEVDFDLLKDVLLKSYNVFFIGLCSLKKYMNKYIEGDTRAIDEINRIIQYIIKNYEKPIYKKLKDDFLLLIKHLSDNNFELFDEKYPELKDIIQKKINDRLRELRQTNNKTITESAEKIERESEKGESEKGESVVHLLLNTEAEPNLEKAEANLKKAQAKLQEAEEKGIDDSELEYIIQNSKEPSKKRKDSLTEKIESLKRKMTENNIDTNSIESISESTELGNKIENAELLLNGINEAEAKLEEAKSELKQAELLEKTSIT